MAGIIARKGREKTALIATVRVEGYESVSRSFDTKGEARTWAAEGIGNGKDAGSKIPRRANLSFADVLKETSHHMNSQ